MNIEDIKITVDTQKEWLNKNPLVLGDKSQNEHQNLAKLYVEDVVYLLAEVERLNEENVDFRNQNEYLRDVNQKTCDELVGLRKRMD